MIKFSLSVVVALVVFTGSLIAGAAESTTCIKIFVQEQTKAGTVIKTHTECTTESK
jgi:hypothetical protein